MKGFLKRDFYLLLPTLKIYGAIFAIMLVVSFFTDLGMSFFSVYVCILSMSGILGLFSYDEANQWQAYAAAAPGGRHGQVEARYALSMLLCAGMSLLLLLSYLASRSGREILGMPFLYGGLGLLYAAIALPLCYRFGVHKGRMFIMTIVVLSAVLGTAGSFAAEMSSSGGGVKFPIWLGLAALAVGMLAILISKSITIRIMEHKEL